MTFDAKERVADITDNLGVHVMAYEGDTSRVLGVSTKDAGDLTNEILNRAYAYHTPQDGNRLKSITNLRGVGTATGATQISKFGYTYTPTGQIDTWTQELGLAGNDATTSIWDIDYDPIYQLKDVKITAPDGTLRNSYSYGYDEAGNRIRETVDTATTTARHNSRNEIFETGGGTRTLVEGTVNRPATVTVNGQSARLKPLSGGMEYLFQKEIPVAEGENEIEVTATDPAGAATTENYTFDVAGVQYAVTHDDNGNITHKRNIETGQVWIYEWDSLNRLLAIQSHELPEWESTRSEFTYDGQSRRVSRKEQVWRGAWEVDSENKYLWVGSKIAQKRTADGSGVEASYTGFGEERIDENGAKVDYYYTRDHLGSVREVVDDSGALKARYSYDPWGRRSKIEGEEDFEVEFGYTGHHFHEESKLHLTWYRAYDAGLGRWLSADPIAEAGGLNLYGYVGNDPVNSWDPLGLDPKDPAGHDGPKGHHIIPQKLTTQCGNKKANQTNDIWKWSDKNRNRLSHPDYGAHDATRYGSLPNTDSRGRRVSGWTEAEYRQAVEKELKQFAKEKGIKGGLCKFNENQIDQFVDRLKKIAELGDQGEDGDPHESIIQDYLQGVQAEIEWVTGHEPMFPIGN